jgi:50S ribosomal subunit-associated GTPase HflX
VQNEKSPQDFFFSTEDTPLSCGGVLHCATPLPDGPPQDAGTPVPEAIPVSAHLGWGLEELKGRMRELLSGTRARFRFSSDRGDLLGLLHRQGQVITESWEDGGIVAEAWVDGKLAGQLKQYLVQ